ncbi:hypothetical protein ACH5RR_006646 [Cinchona calisaya]|uniref:Uncharacterized protein n=1 Tax=Cinchona calisaya TaxID=153742 RepID=A0ABD3APN3_9GENT
MFLQFIAKSLGMTFPASDLKEKKGSGWWLHLLTCSADFASVDCLLPEDNFTQTTAVLRTLFCNGTGKNFGLDLFNLTSLGTDIYVHALVNSYSGINLNTFFAISI